MLKGGVIIYKIGDYIIYKRDVCEITDIKYKLMNDEDYYIIIPVLDKSLKINVPVLNKNCFIKDLMSSKEAEELINRIPTIEIIKQNDKMIENEYKKLMNSNDRDDLIRIIKTTYLRNKKRLDNNKKLGDKDDKYFKQAEQYLYSELSIVLGMSYDEAKKYVSEKVEKISD